MQSLAALTGALCGFLNEARIDYCVLGDGVIGRIDLIVSRAAIARMPAVLRAFCARNELALTYFQRRAERVKSYGLSVLNGDLPLRFIEVRIGGDYLRCGRRLFMAEELLRDRVPAVDATGHGPGYFRAAPAKDFLCHLLRCIDRGSICARDGEHLSEQWRQDPQGVAMQLDRFWNAAREGGVILRAATSGNWEPADASVRALQSALRLRNVPPPLAWLREASRRLKRWFEPAGLLIACLGPEGSGKSSVIRALSEHPLDPFRSVHTMTLRPGLMRPQNLQTGAASRRRRSRGRLGTIAKVMMFAADYWLGYWLRIRPKWVRSTLIVSDRYFDDVLVDPRRYRMHRPRAFARLLLPWIPRPELWLVFDAASEVLHARRPDVGAEEAARQRGEYRRLLRGHDNVAVLDANQSLEHVVAEAQRAIVTQLARRTARRLGLPLDTAHKPLATALLLFFCRRNVPVLTSLLRVLFNSDIRCRLPSDVHVPHPYGIFIHPQAAIGRRVTVMQQVTIGSRDCGDAIAPVIADDVYIGAGARVLGDVRVGQGAVIGANAVVTRDIPPGVTVVGANRIVASTRGAITDAFPADSSVARLRVGTHRGSRVQSR